MRITGDNEEGKAQLDNFIDPGETYPVIATTSKLMTTGVDAQTCQLIVLDQRIKSMTEFKQIIGRGTRINEDYDKLFFTIMDFKKATELFADPDFDGDPVVIYEPGENDPPIPPDDEEGEETEGGEVTVGPLPPDPPPGGRVKYVVGDVAAWVVAERVQYYGKDGKLITESLKDYTRKTVREEFASLDEFLARWTQAEQKQAIIKELEQHGVLLDALAEEVGKELDPFDLVCHIAFDRPPLTRKERAENVRKRDCFTRFGDQARAVLNALLDKYADAGVAVLEDRKVLRNDPLTQFGTPVEIVGLFGGKAQFDAALRELEAEIYTAA